MIAPRGKGRPGDGHELAYVVATARYPFNGVENRLRDGLPFILWDKLLGMNLLFGMRYLICKREMVASSILPRPDHLQLAGLFHTGRPHKGIPSSGFRMDGLYADVAGSPYDPASHELAVVAGKK